MRARPYSSIRGKSAATLKVKDVLANVKAASASSLESVKPGAESAESIEIKEDEVMEWVEHDFTDFNLV